MLGRQMMVAGHRLMTMAGQMVENMGGKVETIVKENVPEEKSAVVSTIRDMVDQGCTIIYGTSYGFMDGMVEAAKEFPDVKFEHCSGYMTADNLGTYFGKIEEPLIPVRYRCWFNNQNK